MGRGGRSAPAGEPESPQRPRSARERLAQEFGLDRLRRWTKTPPTAWTEKALMKAGKFVITQSFVRNLCPGGPKQLSTLHIILKHIQTFFDTT